MRSKFLGKKGFTIIEMVAVLGVIIILFVVAVGVYDNFFKKGLAVRTIKQYEELDRTFYQLFALIQLYDRWPDQDDILSTSNNPEISEYFDADVGLEDFIIFAPVALIGDKSIRFDHDDNDFSCGGTPNNGVNLTIYDVNVATIERINKIIDDDDDDYSCGRSRRYSCSGDECRLIYGLSPNGEFGNREFY